jgi:hypothetical protein
MKTVGWMLLSLLVVLQVACQPLSDDAKPQAQKPEIVSKEPPAQAPESDKQGPEMMAGLRNMALTMTPDQLNITEPATGRGVWGSVTDFGTAQGTATLVTFLDGSTSLYYSTGGGIIGSGDTSEDVRKVSQDLLAELDPCTAQMEARPPQKLPAPDSIRFYAHTRNGLLSSAEIPEADLQSSEHPLFPCYAAAQHVLTQVLKTSGKK